MRGRIMVQLTPRVPACAALAVLVFFSRLWLIREWGSPLPFWDQWDAEAIGLYLPWVNGTLDWTDLFRAHNEHRLFLTRAADLVLYISFGGWNPWAQLTLNAALHAATAAALAALFWPSLPARHRTLLLGGLAVLFTATCGWQNALYGFQSQVYFANLFSVLAIAGLCRGRPLHFPWWFGLGAGTLAYFSNAGGIFAMLAALLAGLIANFQMPHSRREWGAMAVICVGLAAAALLSSRPPQHLPLHAKNVPQFFAVLTHCLAWPWINQGILWVVMQLPLVWLIASRWQRREPLDAAERGALALGIFAVLQAAAIAYSRGAALPEARPLSRYQDPLLLGAAAQFFALLKLATRPGRTGRITGLLWSGTVVAGLISLTETNFNLHLPFKRAQDRANLAIVREYAATGDAVAFTRDPIFSGPHPEPRVVQRVLDDAAFRGTLPAGVLTPQQDPSTGLPWVIRHSPTFTAIGAIALLGLMALTLWGTVPHG